MEEESQESVCLCLERRTVSIRGTTQSSEQEALFQRKSVSPLEASPADQMTQTGAERQAAAGSLSKTLYTVARFVVEPDSQPSSQCTTAAEELDVETRTTESPQMPSASNKELQCSDSDRQHSRPKRKLPRGGSNTVSRLVYLHLPLLVAAFTFYPNMSYFCSFFKNCVTEYVS